MDKFIRKGAVLLLGLIFAAGPELFYIKIMMMPTSIPTMVEKAGSLL